MMFFCLCHSVVVPRNMYFVPLSVSHCGRPWQDACCSSVCVTLWSSLARCMLFFCLCYIVIVPSNIYDVLLLFTFVSYCDCPWQHVLLTESHCGYPNQHCRLFLPYGHIGVIHGNLYKVLLYFHTVVVPRNMTDFCLFNIMDSIATDMMFTGIWFFCLSHP
jgi:hypothetical protein